MKNIELIFYAFKTRQQIAIELNVTPRFLMKKLKACEIEIPPRIQLNFEQQREIYICILGEQALKDTPYEKE